MSTFNLLTFLLHNQQHQSNKAKYDIKSNEKTTRKSVFIMHVLPHNIQYKNEQNGKYFNNWPWLQLTLLSWSLVAQHQGHKSHVRAPHYTAGKWATASSLKQKWHALEYLIIDLLTRYQLCNNNNNNNNCKFPYKFASERILKIDWMIVVTKTWGKVAPKAIFIDVHVSYSTDGHSSFLFTVNCVYICGIFA